MKTCKTCKHWGGNSNIKEDQGHRLKSCDAPLIKYGFHYEEEEIADNGALVEYDNILTGPDFGCVLHEDESKKVKKCRPSGFIAKCQCGAIVGALDAERTEGSEMAKLLGNWLFKEGCTVEPRFGGSWSEVLGDCKCEEK